MANYYATARSNYFQVKDLEAFKEWAQERNLRVLQTNSDPNMVGVCPSDSLDDGGWPTCEVHDEETNTITEVDLFKELSKHLKDDHVAVLIEIGNEKLRYLTGYAVAINSDGEAGSVRLDEIYEQAAELGKNVTRAEY